MTKAAERILRGIFRVCRYHAWAVLAVTLIITGASLYYTREVPLRSSYFDLLPVHDPLVEKYQKNEQYLAQTDTVGLLLTLTDAATIPSAQREQPLLGAAQDLAAVLREDPEFAEVSYTLELSQNIPEQYQLLYALGPEKLAQIQANVTTAQSFISGQEALQVPNGDLAAAYRQAGNSIAGVLAGGLDLSNPGATAENLGSTLKDLLALDATVLTALHSIDRFPALTQAINNISDVFVASDNAPAASQGVFSRDKSQLLMTVRPVCPSQKGVSYCTEVMKALETDVGRTDLGRWGVTVGITGAYSLSAEMNAIINADMQRTTIFSSVAVLLVFFLGFGSLFYTIIAAIPLLVSYVLMTAWAKLACGGFNLMTAFLPALVFGIGIEFGIHLVSRYAEEREKGAPFNRALSTAVQRKGLAIFTAAMTVSLAFTGLLFSHSRALFEMGVISSAGIVFAFVTTLFLFPTLMTLAHFLLRFKHREKVVSYERVFRPVFRFISAKARVIFASVLILTAGVAFLASRTTFQFTSTDLIPKTQTMAVLNDALAHFAPDQTQLGDQFTFFASSPEEVTFLVSQLKENPFVMGVQSALDLLPVNLAQQQQVLNSLNLRTYIDQLDLLDRGLADRNLATAQMRDLYTGFSLVEYAATLNGMAEVASDSRDILGQLREIQLTLRTLDEARAHAAIADLRKALVTLDSNLAALRQLPPAQALLRDILISTPASYRSLYLTDEGKYIVRARMKPSYDQGQNLQEFTAFASSISNDYFGIALGIKVLENYMRRDFVISTILAAALIVLILWFTLRGWMRPLLAAAPLALGYAWMLAGMHLLKIPFNFINITISPLLIGFGVDNGVYLLIRYTEERGIDPARAVERSAQATAAAVIMTSLTTLSVFGSLLLARTPGLRVLGICAILGIGFALLFSLLFLPAALRVERGKRV